MRTASVKNRPVLRRFVQDERGSATVEFMLWLPIFMFLVFLTVDASVLYWRHGEMWNVARDVARTVAIGSLEPGSANDFVRERYGNGAEFNVSVDTSASDSVSVTVTRNPDLLAAFSIFAELLGDSISATVIMPVDTSS